MEKTCNESKMSGIVAMLKCKTTLMVLLSVVVLAVISLVYFYPDALQGNVLRQNDTLQGIAIGHECQQYKAETGDVSRWTNSLFSGMPTFQISPTYESTGLISWINTVYGLGLPSPANLLFMMMIGFFILLMACRTRWYVALLGAIAWGFSTYYIILIGAGHIWKFLALTYVPPTIAGVILCYRGRYLLGGALTALFAMMQLAANHIQMSYYFGFVIAFIALAYLEKAYHTKTMKQWGIATASLLAAALLAVAANSPNLYNTYKYSKETMRGGHSEIAAGAAKASAGGLDKDYITAWSYGKAETFTLLVPNVKGGATILPAKGQNNLLSLAQTPKAAELYASGQISPEDYQYLAQFPQYFGDQPMTNGPVYVGAFIFMLFLIGCVIVKGRLKWAILGVTLLTVMLSWGHNMMWLTDLFIDYFPLYNKFRTVSSILVVAEFTIPLLAMLALNRILTEPDVLKHNMKLIFITLGAGAAVCLFIALFPGIFRVFSEQEQQQYINSGVAQQVPSLFAAVATVRESLISADAWRSLLVIAAGTVVLFLFAAEKIKIAATATMLVVVTLFDLYTVNKRYLNSDSFMTDMTIDDPSFTARAVDNEILRDTTMNYRVYDQQHFMEAMPSYFHKAVGGYHAAKLTRYQDLIDHQIARGNMEVLNMLNTRYFIVGDTAAHLNPGALGNAWFISNLSYVATPKEEMSFMDDFDPATEAVADKRFEAILGAASPKAEGDTIFETTYSPKALTYHAESRNGGIAVFSEVYFPWGWKATIDGEEAEIGRVNYVLRAMRIPAGSHTITMVFDPDSVTVTETLAYAAITIIYLALIAAIALAVLRVQHSPKVGEAFDNENIKDE